jgi:hypothetical protein
MGIRQRYVRSGTRFREHEAEDRLSEQQQPADHLCRNEIVVDVGSTCWGWLHPDETQPETLRIIDHHFHRAGQYPSSSAAVLDLDSKIADWAAALTGTVDVLWIVTHEDPDFDALCATTLVEDIIQHGPSAPGRASPDWFKPDLERIEPGHRWRYQLATAASITDQCKRTNVPRNRTLSAVLHACGERGAVLTSGEFRRRFFGIVRREIAHGRNALTDSVLEYADEFAAEREFLDRQDAAYARDLQRARRAVVSIPFEPAFAARYEELCTRPLLDAAGEPLREHLLPGSARVAVDGVFLRDPECMLFKQFARQDADNSPSGRGFVFTAVVYSQDKQHPLNQGDYLFSLNPEAIPGAHLYPLWTLLQEAEVRARIAAKQPEAEPHREFAGRAAGRWSGHFGDPWFDGGSYKGTIVVTPGAGTWIGAAGQRSDLTDDPVVRLVTDYFESALWTGEQRLEDSPASIGVPSQQAQTEHVLSAPRALVDKAFRIVEVALHEETALFQAYLGYNIGRRLWQSLAPASSGVPLDFDQRHLVIQRESAGCWNRNGVAVAYLDNEEGRRVRDRLRTIVQSMARLAAEISVIVRGDARHEIERLRDLLHQVAELKWQSAQPDVKLARRFFEAIGFERELSLVHDLYHAEVSRNTLRDIASLQRSAGVLEVMVLGVYALEAAHLFASGALETHFAWALAYLILAPVMIGGAVAWLHLRVNRPEARHVAPADGHQPGVDVKRHRRLKEEAWHLLPIGTLFVLLFAAGAWLATISHAAAEATRRQQQEQQSRDAAARAQKQEQREREWQERVDKLQRAVERIGQPVTSHTKPQAGRAVAP